MVARCRGAGLGAAAAGGIHRLWAYQVLLSVIGLSRRADVVEVIGASLVAKAAGWGYRQIAVLVGRPASTVMVLS